MSSMRPHKQLDLDRAFRKDSLAEVSRRGRQGRTGAARCLTSSRHHAHPPEGFVSLTCVDLVDLRALPSSSSRFRVVRVFRGSAIVRTRTPSADRGVGPAGGAELSNEGVVPLDTPFSTHHRDPTLAAARMGHPTSENRWHKATGSSRDRTRSV